MQKIIHTSIHQSRNNNLYIINHLKVVSSKLYYLMSGASMAGGQLQRRIFSEAVCFSDWISDQNFWNIMMPSGKLNRAFFGVFQLFRSELCRRQCSGILEELFRQKGKFHLNFRWKNKQLSPHHLFEILIYNLNHIYRGI